MKPVNIRIRCLLMQTGFPFAAFFSGFRGSVCHHSLLGVKQDAIARDYAQLTAATGGTDLQPELQLRGFLTLGSLLTGTVSNTRLPLCLPASSIQVRRRATSGRPTA